MRCRRARCRARLDFRLQAVGGPAVVEADVEGKRRLSRGITLVAGLPVSIVVISRLDGWNSFGAVVERRVEQCFGHLNDAAQRIVGQVRIGDMALYAGPVTLPDTEPRRPILIMSPISSGLVGSPSTQASQLSPRLDCPFQQLDRAVDRRTFLVAGDQEGDRTLRRAVRFRCGAPRRRRNRRCRPSCRPLRGHTSSPPAISAENGGCDQAASSPTAPRRCGRQTSGAGRPSRAGHRGQSRSNSLMPVFERVFSSTVFTITAQ
jgi:hypothetical protein